MRSIPNNFAQCELSQINICGSGITWRSFAETINELIVDTNDGNLGGEDKRLGAYFLTASELQSKETFGEKVLMYLWNDAFKFDHDKIFRPEYRTLEQLLSGFDTDLFGVFSPDVSFQAGDGEAVGGTVEEQDGFRTEEDEEERADNGGEY